MRRVRPVTVRLACIQLAARPSTQAGFALDDSLAGIAAASAHGAHITVLPECTYPGYVLLRRTIPGGAAGVERALREIARAARKAGTAVCIGVARRGSDGRLRNEAVYFDRRGDEIARYAKMFLWNFDRRWFTAGNAPSTFDTEFGRLGMMICADGRMPEIARTMALQGAWLVLDPTAWVSNGASYEEMHNPQVDYMLGVRARENGIWIAAADKCGSEHEAVHYVGRSMIVAPDGFIVASAGAQKPSIVVADAHRGRDRPFVAALSTAELRALRSLKTRSTRTRVRGRTFRLGVLQGPLRSDRPAALAALRAQGAEAIVDTAATPRMLLASLRALRGLRADLVSRKRMFAPEPARAAALAGADVILWIDPPRDSPLLDVAKARALENRVYVLVCSRSSAADGACLIDPGGNVCAQALSGTPSGFVAVVDAATARDKVVVPGSDVFSARLPRAFAYPGGARR